MKHYKCACNNSQLLSFKYGCPLCSITTSEPEKENSRSNIGQEEGNPMSQAKYNQ